MRTFLLPTPLLFALFLPTALSNVTNDFSAYPQDAQACLYNSADDAGCKSAPTGPELNNCLCKNKNNFVYNSARCIAKSDPSDVEAVYDTLSSNCAGTSVTLSVPKAAFLAAAAAATHTTSAPSPTATSTGAKPSSTTSDTTSNPSPTDKPQAEQPSSEHSNSDNGGLSTGAKIGIGVGIGVALGTASVLLAGWFLWMRQRRRRLAHPINGEDMGDAGSSAGTFNMESGPQYKYAHDNTQQEAAELAPSSWGPHSELTGYSPGGYKDDKKAREPLVAGFENEMEIQQKPVELPAN
ncbi:hypothetical protein F4861DRAFT_539909 [Xylaria intraflava]|nr:hypothetical protein F4861DRAFT_539909 [Xylaria intraflava]